ncbi:MAG: secretin N-terminal domain-containing protein [Candidatus Omnitrophica bacterium]|nr:secretin N-terminal domain-containing protein [Candidatus Omnitrophota bacterium]
MKKRTMILFFFFLMFTPFIVCGQNAVDVSGDLLLDDMPYLQKISMDFEEALLKDVLKAFSKQTGANFVASNLIEEKTITIFLSNVTMEEALMTILSANDLTYETQENNIYVIKPAGTDAISKITKVYQLNYIQVYNMPDAITSNASMDTTMGGGALRGKTAEDKKSILEIISTLLSPYGKIITEQRTNSIIITDVPEVFKQIEETLAQIDVEPVQIMIQAEIIETTTSAIKNIGIKYGSQAQTLKLTYGATADGEGQNFSTPVGAVPLTENFITSIFGAATSLASNSDLFQYGTLTASSMEILMQLFQSNQDTKILSRPRVMTINNEPAIFKVASDTAIGTESVNVTQTQQTISQAERVETGVILKVIPQVNKNGDIFMYLEPSIATTQASTAFPTEFQDPQIRSSSSTVLVKNSDTIVVAGLIKTNNVETTQKVPFLGDIPLFGEAFRSRGRTAEDTEVLIFVTPHIVRKRENVGEKTDIDIQQDDTRKQQIAATLNKYKKQ